MEVSIKDKLKSILYNKKTIILGTGFLLFICYLCCGAFLGWKVVSYNQYDAILGTDPNRVISDLSNTSAPYGVTFNHPVYILFGQPIVLFLNLFLCNVNISILVFQCFVAVVNVYLFYVILDKIVKKNTDKKLVTYLVTALFAFSSPQFIFSSVAETFLFGGFSILLYLAYFTTNYGKSIKNIKNLLLFIFVSCVPLFYVLTNYAVVGLTAPFFVFAGLADEEKNKQRILKTIGFYVFVIVASLLVVVGLALIQKRIWPSTQLWHEHIFDIIKRFLGLGGSELWFDKFTYSFSFEGLWSVIVAFWGYGLFPGQISLHLLYERYITTYVGYSWFGYVLLALFLALFVFSLVMIIKNKKILAALPYLLTLLFMFVFHCFFGTKEAWLYLPNVIGVLLLILGYGLSMVNNATLSKVIKACLFVWIIITFSGSINLVNTLIKDLSSVFPLAEGSVFVEVLKGIATYFVFCIIFVFVCWLIRYIKKKELKKVEQNVE